MIAEKKRTNVFRNSISPLTEIAAYEALWTNRKASFKSLSELFKSQPGSKPSDFVNADQISELLPTIKDLVIKKDSKYNVNLLIKSTFDFPDRLKDAKEPVQVLYYSGNLDYLNTRSVAIVGSRNPSPEGIKRAAKLAKLLVQDDFTIVSGLAQGIDTVAHKTAIEAKGRTIAVIGTPLHDFYPKENKELQNFIANQHLLISQVPFVRYTQQGIHGNRLFFPERNKTMSALTEATIIIEAGETSGTLIQARAAIQQGRKLFILESCFQNKNITWPAKYEKLGAHRVKEYSDIINVLNQH
ncbi:DNA processing protein [Pedobacter steynii]|uniref:DNA processing protein n=1 Tax=Pedobacter steynii TaxID=430522 RepID=A0A1G9KAH4_9SPHI|nr:DNA-processing protein DprA [Pedobacter steynii]NQX38497.1 DNA-protecting protein DprA [Pedobacter steynii]SDL46731.1 DNA processing protein [Pedobacter steynii]